MGIIGFLILGLIAGFIARSIHSGPEPGGIVGTLVVGVLGAVIGGLIASAVGIGGLSDFFDIGTWITAIVGALVFLFIYSAVVGGRATAHR
jgi:uncharacterized membrane protein YeaQ/YmgE (transglycosylase-associated protein family)